MIKFCIFLTKCNLFVLMLVANTVYPQAVECELARMRAGVLDYMDSNKFASIAFAYSPKATGFQVAKREACYLLPRNKKIGNAISFFVNHMSNEDENIKSFLSVIVIRKYKKGNIEHSTIYGSRNSGWQFRNEKDEFKGMDTIAPQKLFKNLSNKKFFDLHLNSFSDLDSVKITNSGKWHGFLKNLGNASKKGSDSRDYRSVWAEDQILQDDIVVQNYLISFTVLQRGNRPGKDTRGIYFHAEFDNNMESMEVIIDTPVFSNQPTRFYLK